MSQRVKIWIGGGVLVGIVASLIVAQLARTSPQDAFEQVYKQYMAHRKRQVLLRRLVRKGDTLEQQKEARDEYQRLQDEIDRLLPKLERTVIASFIDKPHTDNLATLAMPSVLIYLTQTKKYDAAERIGRIMVKHDHPSHEGHALLGQNAYRAGDVAATKQHLLAAANQGTLDSKWTGILEDIKQQEVQERAMENKDQIIAAYKANPNQDDEVTQQIMDLLLGLFQTERYAEGLELGRLMLASAYPNHNAALIGARCAFNLEQFDVAQELMDAVDKFGPQGESFREVVVDHTKLWAEEQKLRAADTAADDLPRVELNTSKGSIVVELFENEAPNTVANFIHLVEDKFYDGKSFHRVLPGFMAQGGSPKGDGAGGPGWTIQCECYRPDARHHFRGSLSMAHGGRDTGGSQFFLTFVPTHGLNRKHTIFGRVIQGLDVLDALQRIDPSKPRQGVEPDKIVAAIVLRKRDHAYVPDKNGR
jgi:cyclophilin family peptidyl-prolyl cis-trans isomerase